MTWQVSPEEWLLDFTTLPRGIVRAGESLDAIDDRLRQMLAAPKRAAIVMPTLAARTPPRPPAPPTLRPPEPPPRQSEPPPLDTPVIPVLEARPEPRPTLPPPRPESGARAAAGEIGAPQASQSSRTLSGEIGAPQTSQSSRTLSGEIGAPQASPSSRTLSGEIGAPQASPSRTASGEIGAPQPPPSRTASGELGASPSRAASGAIGLVMPTLASRSQPAPAPAHEPAAAPDSEPRSTLDVQLVQTPSAAPGAATTGAPVVIPTLTRGGFQIEVDDDEASALDLLNPVGEQLGIPSDDADGEDFMSAVAAAAPLMSSPPPAAGDSLNDAHLEEVIEDLDPEALVSEFSSPSISLEALAAASAEREAAAARAAAARAAVPEKPAPKAPTLPEKAPAPPEKAPPPKPEKAPPPPPDKPSERATLPPPPPDKPSERATLPPPPPPEKAADKPTPPRPPAAAPSKPPPTIQPAQPAGNVPARKRGWYDDAFGEHFASITPIDADASAELDAAFIRKSAELGAGQSLLDVACGDGRHCFAFANLGLMVTGLECSLPQLVRAAQRNEANDAGITLLQGDMRSLPRDRTYDAVTCLGSSLGYFETEEQNKQCLQEMVDVLRPGGKLILQLANRDYLVAVLPCRSWWQGRGCLVLDVADMNYFTNRMRVHRTVVFEDGRQFEHQMYIRLFALHELGRMLGSMGMRVLEVSGSRETRGRFYGATSSEIWLVAQRRDDA